MNQHPKRFERMSVALLGLDARFNNATLFGVDGEAQYGVDGLALCAAETGGMVVLSAKCYERTTPARLLEWSSQFLDHRATFWRDRDVRHFVLTTAATNITAVNNVAQIEKERRRFLDAGIQYDVWGPEEIYNRLRASRSVVRRFLGEIWTQIMFGPEAATGVVQFFEPRVPAHYRNREREIEQVFLAFMNRRWCGLYGIGGSGKSSTAARIANQVRTQDRRPVIWLAARELIDVGALLESLANAVGYSVRSFLDQEQKTAQLRSLTEDHNALIVFDNVTSPDQLEVLLSSVGSGNDVIITARTEDTSVATKFGITPIVIGGLPTSDSALILMQLVGLHDVRSQAVAEWESLATKIGNFPLGLEIVAGDIRTGGPHSPLQYLNERFSTGKWAIDEPSIERWRKELIDSVEKLGSKFISAFENLGVFEGSIMDSDAVAAVCGLGSGDETENFLRALQRRMFVWRRDDGRLSMHPIVIETARLRLAARTKSGSNGNDSPLARHIRHYHEILRRDGGYEWNLRNFPNLVAHELEIVRAIDVVAALWRGHQGADGDRYRALCVEMTVLVSWYLHWRGLWDLRVRLCKRITDSAEQGEGFAGSAKNQIGNLYVDRGWIHLHQDDLDTAMFCAEAGRRWLRRSGDEIFARELQGQIAFCRNDYNTAGAIFAALRKTIRPNSRSWFVFSYRLFDSLLASGDKNGADRLLSSLVASVQHPELVQNEIIEDIHARILYRVSLRRLSEGADAPALESLQQSVRKFQASGIMAPERTAAGIELACLLARFDRYDECRAELDVYLAQARALGDFALAARGEKLLATL
jgi:hypothetical protein